MFIYFRLRTILGDWADAFDCEFITPAIFQSKYGILARTCNIKSFNTFSLTVSSFCEKVSNDHRIVRGWTSLKSKEDVVKRRRRMKRSPEKSLIRLCIPFPFDFRLNLILTSSH